MWIFQSPPYRRASLANFECLDKLELRPPLILVIITVVFVSSTSVPICFVSTISR